MMGDIKILIISGLFIHNLMVYYGVGASLMAAQRDRVEITVKIGIINTVVMAITSVFVGLFELVLIKPYKITYMRPFIYIILIAALCAAVFLFCSNLSFLFSLQQFCGIFIIDSGVLMFVLQNAGKDYSVLQYVIAGTAAGVGCLLVSLVTGEIMEKLEDKNVLPSFRGLPLLLILFGFIGLAFSFFESYI